MHRTIAAALILVFTAGAQAADRPSFIRGELLKQIYDGLGNDLLTGGLGKEGLAGGNPAACMAESPDAEQLRTCAIYNNYRALVDTTTSGGYGVLYGPNIDLQGNDTLGEGKIAGEEYLAYADDGSGRKNVTMMVQIPLGNPGPLRNFDPQNPCIVTAPSSGSRGVYGAIGTAGEWGLKRGCAVAYTDKGTGLGAHDLQNNTVNLIRGERENAGAAGKDSNFTAPISDAEREKFNAETPNRFAFKHAHSGQNPEQDWGENVLQAIEFAFFLLNRKLEHSITPENTIVIGSSVSNGGASSLRAAEQDKAGLIDGVAVAEPQIQPEEKITIQRGSTPVTGGAKPLFDYETIGNLYQPCAALAPGNSASPGLNSLVATRAANRCAALAEKGLVSGATLADQANDALAKLRASGWEAESDLQHASHYLFATPQIALTYANTYGRFKVQDNLCGFSFGATDAAGNPIPAPPASIARIFATGNGIPPTGGINIINNLSADPAAPGPKLDPLSVSASTGQQDFNVDGALCLRSLFTGAHEDSEKVLEGISQVRPSGDLHGKPAIIVHGRADTNVPANHSSRPYFGLNKLVEGEASGLRYYEVTNAQHFETFIALVPGYDTLFVPLHYYFNQAMNLMYDHLKNSAPLPPSQVVRTTPRGGTPGSAPPIALANVPDIAATPAPGDLITFGGTTLQIPD